MSTNRKSYNGAYEVPTKGKCEREMDSDGGSGTSDSTGRYKPSYSGDSKGESHKSSKSEY